MKLPLIKSMEEIMKKTVGLVCVLFMLSVPATALGFEIEFSLGTWYEEPDGTLSFDKSSEADDLDLQSDLGYDDKWQPTGRLKIDMPSVIPNLYLMYTPMKWDEPGSKDVPFSFGDETFQADVEFDSELKMDHLDFALFYGLPGVQNATAEVLKIDLGLNFRLMDFKAEIEQQETGLKESESYFLPIPMIYGAMQIEPMDWISLDFEGRGIAYQSHHYISLIGRVKIMPFGPLFVAGGYRFDNFKIDYKDVDVDANFRGPVAEIGIDF
jgi:outer membrane protein